MLTLNETFALGSLALFSLADLRYRLVPGVELFFLGALLLGWSAAPLQAGIILIACIWGLFRNWPGWLSLLLLFALPAWPVLLAAYGYRKGLIGRADLLAIGGLACLLPLPAVLLSLAGLEVWRKFWACRLKGSIPALPGLLLGIVTHIVLGHSFFLL